MSDYNLTCLYILRRSANHIYQFFAVIDRMTNITHKIYELLESRLNIAPYLD